MEYQSSPDNNIKSLGPGNGLYPAQTKPKQRDYLLIVNEFIKISCRKYLLRSLKHRTETRGLNTEIKTVKSKQNSLLIILFKEWIIRKT